MTGILYPTIIMGGLGLIFGILLAFASKKFFVKIDPRQADIRAALPGANCGGCGFPGCDSFAEALVAGNARVSGCAAGGTALAEKIADILGVEVSTEEPKIAFLKCKGSPDKTVKNCVYVGVYDCREAAVVPGNGPTSCKFSCMGLGTCVRVCPFSAIKIENGLAVVDVEKCVGCGACVGQCPRDVLALVPRKAKVQVSCNSPLKGPDVKKSCSVGCIGCTLCVKTCPVQAIEMKDALAYIDPEKCINCGLCATKCPTGCITDRRPQKDALSAEPSLQA
ncbi:MAG: Fe-S cluster domain-containing protein [Synergistaceae bacterium]|nr:Fe-S cluster domain-containing protein [Synergistaceae bacterium]